MGAFPQIKDRIGISVETVGEDLGDQLAGDETQRPLVSAEQAQGDASANVARRRTVPVTRRRVACGPGQAGVGQTPRTTGDRLARATEDLQRAKRLFVDQQQGASDATKAAAFLALKQAQERFLKLRAEKASREQERTVRTAVHASGR